MDKMINIKISGIRSEVDKLIKDAALHLQFYDPNFEEDKQCSGYHAFKEMCLMKEDICSLDQFNEHKNFSSSDPAPIGYYLLSRIHPNARAVTIKAVNLLREIFKEGRAAKVKIVKK